MSRQQMSFIWFSKRMLGRELDEDISTQVMEVLKSLSLSVLQTRLRDLIVSKIFEDQTFVI
jgi:hypothetical protein